MKTEYILDSAKDLSPQILESIKMAFGNSPVKITVEQLNKGTEHAVSRVKPKLEGEIAESVLNLIFDQLSKKKTK